MNFNKNRIDPFQYIPPRNAKGIYLEWGIQHVFDEFIAFNIRRMATQRLYGRYSSDKTDVIEFEPEVQFVNCLAYKKELEILKYRSSLKNRIPPYYERKKKVERLPCDYVLEISMNFNPRVWRKIKVSSAVSLSVLHDKILAPLMGWVRNYHAYCFTEQQSAAMFGPVDSAAIDMMHLPSNGFVLLDDTKFFLGDVLREKGNMLAYDYDFGDHFEHEITLLKIVPSNESDGKCVLLAGEMASLPEDSVGSPGFKGPTGYQELLDIWDHLSPKKKTRLQNTISEALNYVSRPPFDPYLFDLESCRCALNKAFRSKASVPSGSKIVGFPTGGHKMGPSVVKNGPVREVTTLLRDGSAFIRETLKSRRDSRECTLCYNCGNPNNLQSCGNCRMVWYCGTVI